MAALGVALAPADLTFPMERRHGPLPTFAEFSLCTPLVAAYEDCLRTFTEIVAKKIIELAQTGIRDSARLGRLALQEIRISGGG
jgi:hypothetical protein